MGLGGIRALNRRAYKGRADLRRVNRSCIVTLLEKKAQYLLLTLQVFLCFSSQHMTIPHRATAAHPPSPSPPPSLPISISILPAANTHLKHQRGPLRLLIAPQLEMLAPFERELGLGLAVCAFQPQHHLLGRLGFLVEDGLRLAAVAGLLAVVAALALRDGGCLSGCPGGGSLVVACLMREEVGGGGGGGVVDDEWTEEREKLRRGGGLGTLPALYCVTLCWVCFLHSLPLQ